MVSITQGKSETAVVLAGFKSSVLVPVPMNAAGNNGFWDRVEARLDAMRQTKAWLQRKSGISWTMFQKYRKGSRPTVETLRLIAKHLNTEPDELYPDFEHALADVSQPDDTRLPGAVIRNQGLVELLSSGRQLRRATVDALLAIDPILVGDAHFWTGQADLFEALATMNEMKAARTVAESPKKPTRATKRKPPRS